nr:glycosyl transferase family 1 [Fodinibius sp.]NIV10124.1 glycosyl transferase family 1 [Fodinibius sp.]NIY23748.1 glycosyl transferase family 1 [Fodinibius sp.]
MLEKISIFPKKLSDYRDIIGEERTEEILDLASPLKDARIVHINATAYGGGVAEILQALVPLMRDVGLDAQWQVIQGSDEFFNVTKASHNGLQGMDIPLSEDMKDIWRRYNRLNAEKFEGEYDIVIVHDPQPAGLFHYCQSKGARHWIWRCHIDTSSPNQAYWAFYIPYINEYPTAIFTMKDYVAPGAKFDHLEIIPPTIDPLSPKNTPIPLEKAKTIISRFGVDINRPLLTQVSRFDPWK